jgi:REP element-mobilizing transposase RayT
MHHKRLRRLKCISIAEPIFFITTCIASRRPLLNCEAAFGIIKEELMQADSRHGWSIGRFVVMPDHLHVLCAPSREASRDLSVFVGKMTEWSSKRLARELGAVQPVWQETFFDHLLRSADAYAEKADYMWKNPVRAGLVSRAEDWPYMGDLSGL